MSATPPTSLESCPTCGAEIDVSGLEPLTPLVCPSCQSEMLSGRFVGDYELLEIMGRGGMGVVYRAVDRSLQRSVALKLLHTGAAVSGLISKLEEEAAITASVNHPNVVKVYTTGFYGDRFFIAMELVDKGTLDELIDLQGRIAEAQALEIATQMAQGLRAANQHGLIHRDIKPGNILFADAHTAKIVDFGLAIMEEGAKGSDEIFGTPYYVPPERLEQKPEDFRGDMYSLGATIFHAIAGRPPFEAEDATMVALKHLKSQAVSLQAFAPWVSGSTAYVINKTLSKDPAARYASYDELIEHLEYARNELASGNAQPAEKKRVVLETDEDRQRFGLLTTAMLVLVLLLGGGVGAFFYFSGPKVITGPPETASVGAGGKDATQYEAARQLLLHGKPDEAAPRFHALATQKGTPEPLPQWCFLQSGLAYLLAGKAEPSRAEFTALAAKPDTSKDAAALEAFFRRASALGQSATPVDPDSLKEVSTSSYEALLFFIGGLKNWELGRYEDANSLLQSFQSVDAGGNFAWVTQYKDLANDYVFDYEASHRALNQAKSARTVTQLQTAVRSLRDAKKDLRRPSKLGAKLEEAVNAALAKIPTAPSDSKAKPKK